MLRRSNTTRIGENGRTNQDMVGQANRSVVLRLLVAIQVLRRGFDNRVLEFTGWETRNRTHYYYGVLVLIPFGLES